MGTPLSARSSLLALSVGGWGEIIHSTLLLAASAESGPKSYDQDTQGPCFKLPQEPSWTVSPATARGRLETLSRSASMWASEWAVRPPPENHSHLPLHLSWSQWEVGEGQGNHKALSLVLGILSKETSLPSKSHEPRPMHRRLLGPLVSPV